MCVCVYRSGLLFTEDEDTQEQLLQRIETLTSYLVRVPPTHTHTHKHTHGPCLSHVSAEIASPHHAHRTETLTGYLARVTHTYIHTTGTVAKAYRGPFRLPGTLHTHTHTHTHSASTEAMFSSCVCTVQIASLHHAHSTGQRPLQEVCYVILLPAAAVQENHASLRVWHAEFTARLTWCGGLCDTGDTVVCVCVCVCVCHRMLWRLRWRGRWHCAAKQGERQRRK